MSILGKVARVTKVANGELRGKGFIVKLPDFQRRLEGGDRYAVVYTDRYNGNCCAYCSFNKLDRDEYGYVVELEEE